MPTTTLGTVPTLDGTRRYLDLRATADQTGVPEWDAPREKYGEQVEELRKRQGALTAVRSQAAQADHDHKRATITAVQKNEPAPPDPLPKLLEKEAKLKRDVEVQEAVVLGLSDELIDLRKTLAPKFLAVADAQKAEALAALELGVHGLQQAWASYGEAQWLARWGKGSHKASRSVAGVEHLNKLAAAIEELADTTVPRFVSPAENRKLREGLDAVDVNGDPITYEEADRLHRKKKLHVAHGKPLPRETTGWGDAA
jgi:hypothetical protein